MITDKIILVAKSYLNEEERPANSGFKDPAFELKMKSTGWQKGQSWCAFFCELVWKEAYGSASPLWGVMDKLFSGSTLATFANFHDSTHFETGDSPKPGAVCIWRHGNKWEGHAGIVTDRITDIDFTTIEGNTNTDGSREGYEVAAKIRAFGMAYNPNGLNIVGFIYPTEKHEL